MINFSEGFSTTLEDDSGFMDNLLSLEEDDSVAVYVSDNIIAVHVLPEYMPLGGAKSVVYVAYDKLVKGKTVILFGGNPPGDQFDHEGLVTMAEEYDVFPSAPPRSIGGGHLNLSSLEEERGSFSYGSLKQKFPHLFTEFTEMISDQVMSSMKRRRSHY